MSAKQKNDTIIGTRSYQILGKDDLVDELLVDIFLPFVDLSKSPDYLCRIRLRSENYNVDASASGVDAFQSLILALQLISLELQKIEVEIGASIQWLGMDGYHLTFAK